MRILLVNRFFGGEQVPTGRMLHDVARQLASRDHTVEIIASRNSYTSSEGQGSPSSGEFITHFVFNLPIRSRLLSWIFFWIQALVRIPLLNWDRCVLLTDPPFLVVSAWVSRLLRRRERPVVWWTMDLYPEALAASSILKETGFAYRFLYRMNNLGLGATSGVVALGEKQKELLSRYPALRDHPHKILVVPPWDGRPLSPVSPEDTRFLRKLGLEGKKIALYAGNLGEGHCWHEIAAAARSLSESNRDDWTFVFAIRGSGRTPLIEETAGLENVRVLDYLPPGETADLLWSATVHLITMKPGWEGIVVPSKLYGVIQTEAPVLFLGPPEADTAREIRRLDAGVILPAGASGPEVVKALEMLAQPGRRQHREVDSSGPSAIADFILHLP